MSTALIGITIIQMYYIQWQASLAEENFDSKVVMAMNKVKDRLLEDTENYDNAVKFFSRPGGTLFGADQEKLMNNLSTKGENKWQQQRLQYELSQMPMRIDPNYGLKNIDKDNLHKYIIQEMKNQNINLKYDYGVFSNDAENYLIINGNYVAQIGDEGQSSTAETPLTSNTTEYQIQLFNNDKESPGYLKVIFPQKNSMLLSEVLPSMISSILLTGLILFCFSYTLYIIFKQKKLSEMKTDFINNMTHEFKTPIATISLASDSMVSPMISGNPDKIKRFAGIIKQENIRMLNQVEKVLQMATIDKEDFQIKSTSLQLHDIINQAVANSRLKVEKRNGTISTNLQAHNDIFLGDATHISNIVHNLLDNAEKYSKNAPEVFVSTRNKKSGIEIEIADKGIGMTKEAQKHIFDKFYRVHTGNLHDVKGFGLGLSYVKALVVAHKGTVKVKSELGKGSNFTIFLPQTEI
jgi:two-component system phosphate regulon sensor histidine kinase PhoR